VRSNVTINYNIIEEINTWNYAGCSIEYENTNTLPLKYRNWSK